MVDYSKHVLFAKATEHEIKVVDLRERFQMDEEPIGSGAFGYVYSAIDLSNGDRVAVKLLNDPKVTDETVLEFKRVMKIPSHPYVVKYRELLVAVDTNGFPRLVVVMDLVVGSELFDSIVTLESQGKRMCNSQLFNLFFNLSSALHHIHEHGVAHRDIKPENVMIRAEDQMPVIVDFGLACISNMDCTNRGVAGTPGYVGPEFWALGPAQSGILTLDGSKKTDMYALGATFFMCMTFWTYSDFVTRSYRLDETNGSLMQIYQSLYKRGLERWSMPPIRSNLPKRLYEVPEFTAVVQGLLIMNPARRMGHDELYDHLYNYYERISAPPAPPQLDDPDDPPPPSGTPRNLNKELSDAWWN